MNVRVIDISTQTGISHAQLHFNNMAGIHSTDSTGHVVFRIPDHQYSRECVVQISRMGYSSLQLSLDELKKGDSIFLTPQPIPINTFEFSSSEKANRALLYEVLSHYDETYYREGEQNFIYQRSYEAKRKTKGRAKAIIHCSFPRVEKIKARSLKPHYSNLELHRESSPKSINAFSWLIIRLDLKRLIFYRKEEPEVFLIPSPNNDTLHQLVVYTSKNGRSARTLIDFDLGTKKIFAVDYRMEYDGMRMREGAERQTYINEYIKIQFGENKLPLKYDNVRTEFYVIEGELEQFFNDEIHMHWIEAQTESKKLTKMNLSKALFDQDSD